MDVKERVRHNIKLLMTLDIPFDKKLDKILKPRLLTAVNAGA